MSNQIHRQEFCSHCKEQTLHINSEHEYPQGNAVAALVLFVLSIVAFYLESGFWVLAFFGLFLLASLVYVVTRASHRRIRDPWRCSRCGQASG